MLSERVDLLSATVPIHHALFDVIHVEYVDEATGFDNENSDAIAVIMHTLAIAVVAQPARSAKVVAVVVRLGASLAG